MKKEVHCSFVILKQVCDCLKEFLKVNNASEFICVKNDICLPKSFVELSPMINFEYFEIENVLTFIFYPWVFHILQKIFERIHPLHFNTIQFLMKTLTTTKSNLEGICSELMTHSIYANITRDYLFNI